MSNFLSNNYLSGLRIKVSAPKLMKLLKVRRHYCFFKFNSHRFPHREMDGTAAAFATCAGPDCLKDVIPKLGSRLKVYNALKLVIDQGYKEKVRTLKFLYILG